MNNTNSNKEDLKINNDEGIFYDKPQYDNEITLSRLVPVNTKGTKFIIGKGALCEVYIAKDYVSEKIYAVKQMEKKFILSTLNTLQTIYDEIEIQGRIFHPNIVKLYNYYENTTSIYMIMEYVNNGNLYSIIRRKKALSEYDAYNFFYQVCKSIYFLHKNNIIHRDIKAENILIDDKNNCKLCDFGWSVILNKDYGRKTFCGTMEYMAPEIINNEEYDKSIDIWSLGVLLYELIHGYNPFDTEEKQKEKLNILVHNIINENYKINENVSKECKDLIEKMLEKDPKKRIKIEEILIHPFIINNKYLNKENVDDDELKINTPYINNFHCTPEKEKTILRNKTYIPNEIKMCKTFTSIDINNNNIIHNIHHEKVFSKDKIKNFTKSLLFDDDENEVPKKDVISVKSSKNLPTKKHLDKIKPVKLKFQMDVPNNKNVNTTHKFKKNRSVNFLNSPNDDNKIVDIKKFIVNNNNNKNPIIVQDIKKSNLKIHHLKNVKSDEFIEPSMFENLAI